MNISNDILTFGYLFSNRLDTDKLEVAMDYINYNESKLALETLLDYLCEYDIKISGEEYRMALSLAEYLNITRGNTLNCLNNLVQDKL